MSMHNFCGIDIGCTNIKLLALVNTIVIKKTVPSGDNLSRNELINIIKDFCTSYKVRFDGIGIAFSGCTKNEKKVYTTTLNCLQNLSVDDFSELSKNVFLINDSNATALAGTLQYPYAKVLVGITNGTGIGIGIAINGKLFTGANGLLGEIYGNPVILESSNSIKKIGQIVSGSKILKELDRTNNSEIVHVAAKHLGTLLVQIIHFYNPDVIYFSGGGFSFQGFLNEAIIFAKQRCYPSFLEGLSFKQSVYGNYAGCIGAIKLVREKIR